MSGKTMPTNVFQSQIDALGDQLKNGFDEVKQLITRLDDRMRRLETQETGCSASVNERMLMLMNSVADIKQDIQKVFNKEDANSKELEELRNKYNALKADYEYLKAILKWLLGIAGAVLVAIIIAIATGKAVILFQ